MDAVLALKPGAIVCPLLVVLVFGGVVGLFVYLRSRSQEKIDDAWSSVAETYGLQYNQRASAPTLSGEYDSEQVHVSVKREHDDSAVDDDDPADVDTIYEVPVSERVPSGLSLGQEDFSTALVKAFGGDELEIGHPTFDDHFFIRADEPERAREFLDRAPIREALLDLYDDAYGIPMLEDGTLKIRQIDVAGDPEDLSNNIEALVSCARRLAEVD